MNYFKLFEWGDFFHIIIIFASGISLYSISDCNGKDAVAIGGAFGFLWVLITSIKKVRELENQIKVLSIKN